MSKGNDLPGFYRDPDTGRYYAIPVNPGFPSPSFLLLKKQKEREKTSFNKNPLEIKIHPGICRKKKVSGLPEVLKLRQNGLVEHVDFAAEVSKARLRQLQRKNTFYVVEEFDVLQSDINACACQFVIAHDSFYVGAWSVDSSVTIRKIPYDPSQCDHPPHMINDVEMRCHAVLTEFKHGSIAHLCPAHIGEDQYILLCVNVHFASTTCNPFQLIPADPLDYPRLTPLAYRFESQEVLRCCAWNDAKMMYAIGTADGIYLNTVDLDYPRSRLFHTPHRDHRAIEFNASGDVLYTVGPSGKMATCDLRVPFSVTETVLGRGVSYMKMLKNDFTLITSGFDNKLLNVDLRMNKPVFEYSGHANNHRKLPFSFDEEWNVLCSPGQDNVTRFWNLRRGEPLASLDPPIESADQVYAVLTEKNCRLITNLFVSEKMFCYEPL